MEIKDLVVAQIIHYNRSVQSNFDVLKKLCYCLAPLCFSFTPLLFLTVIIRKSIFIRSLLQLFRFRPILLLSPLSISLSLSHIVGKALAALVLFTYVFIYLFICFIFSFIHLFIYAFMHLCIMYLLILSDGHF